MNRRHLIPALVSFVVMALGASFLQGATATESREWGPWTAVVFDEEFIQDVRVSGDDIFIKLQPEKRNAKLTMKNSMAEGGPYRKWFNGETTFVAQENSGRSPNTWPDRMQTGANYIDYYADGKLFLRLKRQ